MLDRTPYTYHLFHIPTQKNYYGSRFAKGCHPNDLWVKYFSSSPIIKDLIKQYGKDSFLVKVRKVFECPIKCQHYENKVLRRLGVPYNENWYNRHYGHVYHKDCQSKGGKVLSEKRKNDPVLDIYLKECALRGALTAASQKNTEEYKLKRSIAGKVGGKHKNREKSAQWLKNNNLTKNTKWMFNESLEKYKRVPETLVQDHLNTGWILKFRTPWNKGLTSS